jgi:hypothetical protein
LCITLPRLPSSVLLNTTINLGIGDPLSLLYLSGLIANQMNAKHNR